MNSNEHGKESIRMAKFGVWISYSSWYIYVEILQLKLANFKMNNLILMCNKPTEKIYFKSYMRILTIHLYTLFKDFKDEQRFWLTTESQPVVRLSCMKTRVEHFSNAHIDSNLTMALFYPTSVSNKLPAYSYRLNRQFLTLFSLTSQSELHGISPIPEWRYICVYVLGGFYGFDFPFP